MHDITWRVDDFIRLWPKVARRYWMRRLLPRLVREHVLEQVSPHRPGRGGHVYRGREVVVRAVVTDALRRAA